MLTTILILLLIEGYINNVNQRKLEEKIIELQLEIEKLLPEEIDDFSG